MPKLNLGCGNDIRLGWVNLDRLPFPGVDVQHDINLPLPFPDNEFDEVRASHILEHVFELIPLMNELFRIINPGGSLFIAVPWWAGTWARGDPSHRHFFDHNSFSPFSDWHGRDAYIGLAGPWEKVSQTYREDPAFYKNTWLKRAGFSPIYCMETLLRKPKL